MLTAPREGKYNKKKQAKNRRERSTKEVNITTRPGDVIQKPEAEKKNNKSSRSRNR